MKLQHLAALTAASALCATLAHADETVVSIPLKPDPPPAIDGDLAEWNNVPNQITLNEAKFVTFGTNMWKSPADLSAKITLAWRSEFLFLAADVTDDKLSQTQRGLNMWKGDHLELYLDTTPGSQPERTAFGAGQFHIGLSPGNFGNTGNAMSDLPAEAVVFVPNGTDAKDILVASKRTPTGYTLEAAIPWTLLGLKAATATPLGIEVGVSDTDGAEARQEKLMTLGTAPWKRDRSRLLDAVLAPANGVAPPVVSGVDVGVGATLKNTESTEIPFEAPDVAAGREAVLVFDARLQSPKMGGYTNALGVQLNGQPITGDALRGRELAGRRVDGTAFRAEQKGLWVLPYAPDYESPDKSPNYALEKGRLAHFELDVTKELKAGTNVLKLTNGAVAKVTNDLIVSPLKLEFRVPFVPVAKLPAPTGAIPNFALTGAAPVAFTANQKSESELEVALGAQKFNVVSQFSTPDGKWSATSNAFFTHKRTIEKRGEALVVRDEFVNLTPENLPLMQRHSADLGALQKVWLAGLSPASKIGSGSEPANPSSFGVSANIGAGLMPLDDVGLVHVVNWSDGAKFGLSDNSLVLKPGATHVSEWAIVPTATPDYYAFVNAARRLREVNFPIDGGFAFLPITPAYAKWSDQQITDFAANKSVKYLSATLSYPMYKGTYAHGTAFQTLDLSLWKTEIARRHKLLPDVKEVTYYHSFLDVIEDGATRYADARLLRSDGTQGDYGLPNLRLFVPTKTNDFGRDTAKNIDLELGELGLDGIYWDEMEYSAYAYTYGGVPWDGVSADIDATTHKILRPKTSVALASQDWRLDLAKRILAHGPLIGNGAPHTRSMMQLHFPRFIETGSISNLARGQLFTPIALGDHLTEKTGLDAYHTMLGALDYGAVYYWYNAIVVPNHQSLDSKMFPITPVQLGPGFIIGQERIITKTSGLWGWNDNSKHQVFVYDDGGRLAENFGDKATAKTYQKDGKTVTELRLPQDWSAAIVRG